jgi:hypothetical protein
LIDKLKEFSNISTIETLDTIVVVR